MVRVLRIAVVLCFILAVIFIIIGWLRYFGVI